MDIPAIIIAYFLFLLGFAFTGLFSVISGISGTAKSVCPVGGIGEVKLVSELGVGILSIEFVVMEEVVSFSIFGAPQ